MSGDSRFKTMYGGVMRNRIQPTALIDIQELGAELRIYGEIEGDMRNFNPSIAWDGDKLRISIRECNFGVERGGDWFLRDGSAYSKTNVLYGDLDPDTLQVSNAKKLKLSDDTPTRTKVAGLEDVRLFKRKDGMHAIGFESDRLTKHLHNASASLAEYLIVKDELKYIRTLEKPYKEVVEKNWNPPDVESKEFDFTYSDTQVYKDGRLIGEPSKTQMHGGSILLKQKDGYLSIVHEKKRVPMPFSRGKVYDNQKYITYLAKHDNQGVITKLSKPFTFGTLENIEFASGFAEYMDEFIITFGIRDCKYGIMKIKQAKLLSLFEV